MGRLPGRFLEYLALNPQGAFPFWAWGVGDDEEPAPGAPPWRLSGGGIEREVQAGRARFDHLEMSGFEVSAIVSYGTDRRGRLRLHRHVVWPRLRTWPNDTHASLSAKFRGLAGPRLRADGKELALDRPDGFRFDGVLSAWGRDGPLAWTRLLFPDPGLPALVERWELANASGTATRLAFEGGSLRRTVRAAGGPRTRFAIELGHDAPDSVVLGPGAAMAVELRFSAREEGREGPRRGRASPPERTAPAVPARHALEARRALAASLESSLVLETGDPALDAAFRLAKLRASESIFRTRGGLMHSPGGASYYAALWTNDQCEYANPYFAWSGYGPGLEQAMNGYRRYAALMDPGFGSPLPTSIVAEGEGIWAGAGDRGDAAMYAQGAGRFLLAAGRRDWAEELLPAVDWCLEWSRRRRAGGNGPVESDSDELEGRFPCGSANLSTSTLHYDALVSRAHLARSLGDGAGSGRLEAEAADMRRAIVDYFAARVEGFDTWRYCEGNDSLRAWICLPLTAGIPDRAGGTLEALFSDRLWTAHGLRTDSRRRTVWDRSTLFALRGAFAAGAVEEGWRRLRDYAGRRLLGSHVPYPAEAFPEGNRRHLAAESALLCRALVEGLVGLRPTGLRSFDWTPRLPAALERVSLRGVAAFGALDPGTGSGLLDLEYRRAGPGRLFLDVTLRAGPAAPPRRAWSAEAPEGETARVSLGS